MNEPSTTVFWSYAHEDDSLDGGRLLLLADHLRAEFSLQTGASLELFLDRDSIAWGEEWEKRIDTALSDSAFLIPVITPRFFTRPECRRELLTFWSRAQSRELGELLLPILYVGVQGLDDSNSDEAVRLVARTQYENWTDLRLSGVSSDDYRKAVNRLAVRLQTLIGSVAAKRLDQERLAVEQTDNGEPDLEALLARAQGLWPAWLDAVHKDEVRAAQQRAIIRTYTERRNRLRKANVRASVMAATYQEEGLVELPLVRENKEWVDTYHAKTIELAPIVAAVVTAAERNQRLLPMVAELRATVDDAVRIIRANEEETAIEHLIGAVEYVKQMPYLTQTWQEIVQISRSAEAKTEEANDLVMRWASELERAMVAQGTTLPAGEGERDTAPHELLGNGEDSDVDGSQA